MGKMSWRNDNGEEGLIFTSSRQIRAVKTSDVIKGILNDYIKPPLFILLR
jgi:hypothetical protein